MFSFGFWWSFGKLNCSNFTRERLEQELEKSLSTNSINIKGNGTALENKISKSGLGITESSCTKGIYLVGEPETPRMHLKIELNCRN